MKRFKLFLCVALFGAMSFGAYTAYEHYTMTAEELALLENIEALTLGENSHPGCCGTTHDQQCMDDNGQVWGWAYRC